MQLLMKSKVKFVSAVGVHLLASFWICLWLSLSSRSQVGHPSSSNTAVSLPLPIEVASVVIEKVRSLRLP